MGIEAESWRLEKETGSSQASKALKPSKNQWGRRQRDGKTETAETAKTLN